jgi:phosphatidylserine/phosphatidylglycerophosphate/cardiolipin synthase-like enzyme
MRKRVIVLVAATVVLAAAPRADAADRFCDATYENCRTPLLDLIRNERMGIDVAFWFMSDTRYATALIERWRAGVPVRVIMDTEANASYSNETSLQWLRDAGIPMLEKTAGGIVHWKMMLFAGQNVVEFSGAIFSPNAFVPAQPYVNFVDEVIVFSDDPSIVNSFKRRYDDVWTATSGYTPYANISGTRTRSYATFAVDPDLNFPPYNDFRSRSLGRYNAEGSAIDAIMFRITDRRHSDALIAARGRGVRVRLITDEAEYRDPTRLWHAYNVDMLHAAGVQVRLEGHEGSLHQKSTLLRGQRMVIFGSSNWTSPSATYQLEHNIFTTRPHYYDYFADQFDRKWTNGAGHTETKAFVPLPPGRPVNVRPTNGASGQALTMRLTWHAGFWAHKYDIYIGTTVDPPLLVSGVELGPSETASDYVTYDVAGLQPGTTYYWRIVSKTMANVARGGDVWSFRTAGDAPSGSLPAGWQGRDIGSVGLNGSASESGGTFTVRGAGADVWGTGGDAFHYAYRPLSGNGTIVARVASLAGSDAWTKVGVMLRASTATNAAYAFMIVSKAKGLAFQWRSSTGAAAAHRSGGSGTAPRWVRLVRSGNTISAAVSTNGSTWITVGSASVSLPSSALVGLAVTSHTTGSLATGVFDHVAVGGG